MTPADASAVEVTLSGRELALMRRKVMALRGKAGVVKQAFSRSDMNVAVRPAMAVSSAPENPLAAAPSAAAPTTVSAARLRRQALSQSGKAALPAKTTVATATSYAPAPATTIAVAMPGQNWQAAIAKDATGRQKAMQRRVVQSLAGSTKAASAQSRPSGRMRVRMEVAPPSKVNEGPTLPGRAVTGTPVERSKKVIGNEPGSCRVVTGTGSIGAEQSDALCASRPAPGKVGVSHAPREHKVTGAEVGRSGKVTGDELGACRGITGTEYLAAERFDEMCDSRSAPAAAKVLEFGTARGKSVTGTALAHTDKITGDESGACRGVTGTQYIAVEQLQALSDTDAPLAPRKVSVMSSRSNQTVSGTEVERSSKVTGDEKCGCKAVTGTEHIGANQQQAVCAVSTPVAPVAKVAIDQTWRGQPVTGSYVGRSALVTGAESGGCSPISGTPYIGRSQYNSFCETSATQAQEARIKTSALIAATAVTGDRPGADNAARSSASSGGFVSRPSTWVEPPRAPAPVDFSISTPARAAQQKQSGDVTGTGCNSERITGPVNKAHGLITGTPEFRHRDLAPTPTAQEAVISAAQRLTGEGSQAGRQVTGDAWNAMSKVTGTEGSSCLSRNPSARGNPRGMGVSAAHFREVVEHPAVAQSRITGSSGHTGRGSLVTLSGGARG